MVANEPPQALLDQEAGESSRQPIVEGGMHDDPEAGLPRDIPQGLRQRDLMQRHREALPSTFMTAWPSEPYGDRRGDVASPGLTPSTTPSTRSNRAPRHPR